MDRNIPHVRNIFDNYHQGDTLTEVCIYDRSPGRRRRKGIEATLADFDFLDEFSTEKKRWDNYKANERERKKEHSQTDRQNAENVQNARTDRMADQERNSANSRNNSYSSKTLTDRDIRHLERHLSMKKTIRKQISRNLEQAFVEDPKVLEADTPQTPVQPTNDKKSNASATLTLTRAKMSRSDQNVLQMLKEPGDDKNVPRPLTDDNISARTSSRQSERSWKAANRHSIQGGAENVAQMQLAAESKPEPVSNDGMFSSFWKMFSTRKGKR